MSVSFSPSIDELIHTLCCLPGVGPKSAQRMAFHLLERQRPKAKALADAIHTAIEKVDHCERCRNLAEEPLCRFCADPRRDVSHLCIVESPADVLAIEQTSSFRGFYFVLLGHLSPLDGIGPEHIGLDKLAKRLEAEAITEIILATNATVEGEATAHYLAEMAKSFHIKTTRIARGVPLGGELEFVDTNTLSRALTSREAFES